MKKSLLIVLVICLLLLGACGSVTRTGASSAQKPATVTLTSPQFACHVLHMQDVQFQQQIQTASAHLSAADADENDVGQWEHVLMRLHWILAQARTNEQACKTA
jgi:uncharacterized protein YcfL